MEISFENTIFPPFKKSSKLKKSFLCKPIYVKYCCQFKGVDYAIRETLYWKVEIYEIFSFLYDLYDFQNECFEISDCPLLNKIFCKTRILRQYHHEFLILLMFFSNFWKFQICFFSFQEKSWSRKFNWRWPLDKQMRKSHILPQNKT